MKIAVLASTRGTDLQAIIDAIESGELAGVELSVVVSDKENCYALERAREQGYEGVFVNPRGEDGGRRDREEFDREVAEVLKSYGVELVVLVGFMRILSSWFVGEFEKRIINVHPALIPKFSGESFFGNSVHEAVLEAGEKESGMTIHFVDEGCDTGEIILQKSVEVGEGETAESLKEKVQGLEKKWYPWVIGEMAGGRIEIGVRE